LLFLSSRSYLQVSVCSFSSLQPPEAAPWAMDQPSQGSQYRLLQQVQVALNYQAAFSQVRELDKMN
jgi:hypothetical protein